MSSRVEVVVGERRRRKMEAWDVNLGWVGVTVGSHRWEGSSSGAMLGVSEG